MKMILVIEDDELNRELITQQLEDDYEIVTANDGAAGLAMAEKLHPDLILMDLSLPIVDGWETTRRLKSSKRTKSIPIIALTAHAMEGDEETALEAGCDDYISKPVDEDVLFEKLHKFFS